ncbi:ribonuclease H-like domain-containing protein [Halostella salina]|uniref:ribonuclease H-like domain-containing protein n=1 Tax=Halostella salina TaxID=1547897 RepID=UPI000EF78BC3|nr:ribonuclease H-like domain-containing protein [Halostella salina]
MRIENSFIPVDGVGEATERRLWRDGVTRWEAFDPDLLGPTTGERVEEFIATAWERLDDGDADFFAERFPQGSHWRLYENFRSDVCYFDIETTGLSPERDRVTTVSFHQDGETTTLVRGENLTADAVERQFADASLVATFNGKRFDVPFLETSFDVSVDTPHVDLMYPCRQVGLTGGLKAIEQAVGLERDRPDISGEDAVRLWREYEAGNDGALDTLVSYNREDAANLATLMETVTERLHADVFEAERGDDP